MNGNIMKSAGVAFGITVGLILAVGLILIANNNRKVRTQYDERQLRVRGDAYRYGFYSVMICEVIMFILEIGEFPFPIDSYILHFTSVIIGCMVLSGYCIWKDAYWGLNNNRRRYGIILIVSGLLNALPIVMALRPGADIDFPYVNLIVCIMLITTGIELIVKHLLDKREEKIGSDA